MAHRVVHLLPCLWRFALVIGCIWQIPCHAAEAPIDFSNDVLPILSDRCFHCHGPDEQNRQADLRLDVKDRVFSATQGQPLVVPGSPEQSELFLRVSTSDEEQRMPPRHAVRQLKAAEVEILRRWIAEGAEWEQHWAFIPPQRPRLPQLTKSTGTRNAIDFFVRGKQERRKVQSVPPAPQATLARRVAVDLTGLPLQPSELERFEKSDAVDAYERLVDRLLASPRYGEQMAVGWLDAARYADTDGYQNDRIRYMWAYRDWLIDALNSGMPFDQFTVEQLAGDMLPEATLRQQIATGFCRNHRINSEGGSIPAEWAVEYVVDRVDTLATVWLGLTIGCARCHDHKYDPITQREYYELFAYFNNVPEWGLGPNNGNSPPFIKLPASWPHLEESEDRLIPPQPYELVTTQTSVVRPKPGNAQTVMVMSELPQPRATYLLRRGQYDQPATDELLTPAIPAILAGLPNRQSNGGQNHQAVEGRENRLSLARWLVSDSNPLTARVITNRYWQHFFGVGLVKTSENFGVQGERPSHPDLLDWLAREFVTREWDPKALHRCLVTSATYRQSSAATDKQREKDPENRLLARGPRGRLTAQEIRDQALLAAGLLVERMGGESVKPYMPPGIWRSVSNNKYTQDHGAKLYRRSLYTYWRRTLPPPTMLTFNAAEREVCIVRKAQTNSPLQALTLMNNVVFVESARMMAERMLTEGGKSLQGQVELGFRIATGRRPSPAEVGVLIDAYQTYLDYFAREPEAASKLLSTGEHPVQKQLPESELAAMTMVASTLLNLDEAITQR